MDWGRRMKYELRLGKQGYDVFDKVTNQKFNKEPLSSKSKALALVRTLTDKKNENEKTRSDSMAMRILRRNLD